MPPIFASVRCRKLYGFGDLKAAETHASGVGETAEARRVREGPRAIALDLAKGGVRPLDVGESHDIVDRWKILKKHFKARERKGSAIALHLLCIVSPEAFDGDLSDPDNTDGRRLLNAARVWAETEFGKGTVFHARRDLDEEGQCVVDICVAPVRQMRAGRHPPKPTISTRRALEENRRTVEPAQTKIVFGAARQLGRIRPQVPQRRPATRTVQTGDGARASPPGPIRTDRQGHPRTGGGRDRQASNALPVYQESHPQGGGDIARDQRASDRRAGRTRRRGKAAGGA